MGCYGTILIEYLSLPGLEHVIKTSVSGVFAFFLALTEVQKFELVLKCYQASLMSVSKCQ